MAEQLPAERSARCAALRLGSIAATIRIPITETPSAAKTAPTISTQRTALRVTPT